MSRRPEGDGGYPGQGVQEAAEILFTATVNAEVLRLRAVPKTSVEFSGDAADSSNSGSIRSNLPDRVVENTIYRDVRIDYAIAAKLRMSAP